MTVSSQLFLKTAISVVDGWFARLQNKHNLRSYVSPLFVCPPPCSTLPPKLTGRDVHGCASLLPRQTAINTFNVLVSWTWIETERRSHNVLGRWLKATGGDFDGLDVCAKSES
jgi:hypothetical protein